MPWGETTFMDQQQQIPAAEGGNGQSWEISQALHDSIFLFHPAVLWNSCSNMMLSDIAFSISYLLTQICIPSTLASCNLQKCSLFGTHSTVIRSQTQDTLLEPPVLCHWQPDDQQPSYLIFHMCCTGGTECHSRTPGSHSVCAVRTPLGVDRRIFHQEKNSCWVVFSL